MLMHPVFIAISDKIDASLSDSPTLVEDGSTLSIILKAKYPNELIYNIKINGVVNAVSVYTKTIVLDNIKSPMFVTASTTIKEDTFDNSLPTEVPTVLMNSRGTVSGTIVGPLPTTTVDTACCGIRSVKLSMQDDGSIIGTVSGLKQDVYNIMSFVMSGASNVAGANYTISSWREDGVITTLTAVSKVNNTFEKIPTSAVFKTVPTEIYNLHKERIIAASIQNPLEAPDSNVYIKQSDIYGTDGWTVQEILDVLKIDAKVPSGFNYHVYQLSVTRGAPVISLIYNLLPIPGLVIERQSMTSGSTIASYHITIAKGHGHFTGTVCKTLGSSSVTVTYKPTIIGLPGEPRYITVPTPFPDTPSVVPGTVDTKLTRNLIGAVFSIDANTSVVHTQSNVPTWIDVNAEYTIT